MGMIAKLCGIVTVFGALNWAALGIFNKDVVVLLDQGGTTFANVLMAAVALGSMFMLAIVAKPKKDG